MLYHPVLAVCHVVGSKKKKHRNKVLKNPVCDEWKENCKT